MEAQQKNTIQDSKNKSGTSQAYRLPKDHQDYWKGKLKKRSYKTRDGEGRREVPEWQVQIQYRGKQRWFNLGTANQETASVKARDIYNSLKKDGWDKTLEEYKPEMLEKRTATTVGEFIEEVRKISGLKDRTLAGYARKFRKIVADIMKIPSDNSRFNHKTGGYQQWLSKVDSVKLSKITPKKVQTWKISYIKEKGTNPTTGERDPMAEKKAKVSVNSILRNAMALFTEKTLRFVSVDLPDGSPFQGVEFEKPGKNRYTSQIDIEETLVAGKNELSKDHPEQYKVLILGLTAGFRPGETDKLKWEQLNFDRSTITVETTEHAEVKTSESEAEVDVDPYLLDILRSYKKESTSEFVINSNVEPRQSATYHHYRCTVIFEKLGEWLERRGMTDPKPIHGLRKEFGSEINRQAGIYAASEQLRHSDIRTTHDHYVGKKERVVVPLGKWLKEPSLKVVPS